MAENRPDRGYAYVILVASFFGHFIIYGITYCLGLFYIEFRQTFYDNKGAVALISSLNTAFVFLAGPVSSFLTNKYRPRVVCISGGLIAACAFVCSVFAYNIYILYCTFGVLSGFGLGLSYIPVITILGGYFIKRRSLFIAIAVLGSGIGNLGMAPLLQYVISLYGWRGSCLFLAGLSLNLCVVGALLRPINFQSEKGLNVRVTTTLKETAATSKLTEESLTTPAVLRKTVMDTCLLNISGSLVSLNSTAPPPAESKGSYMKVDKEQGKKLDHLNLFILKDASFVLLCLNNFAVLFGVILVLTHLPAFSISCGHTKQQSSFLLAFVGIGNLTGRVIFGFLAHFACISEIGLYVIIFVVCGLSVALTSAFTDLVLISVSAVIFGTFYGAMGPLLPLVVIKVLDLPLSVSGFGYIMLFEALGATLGPSAAEWLFDHTGDYTASFYLASAMLCMSSILMIYPWWKAHTEHDQNRSQNG